jgi:glycosyltransferase involved in cell wall biosynthesis
MVSGRRAVLYVQYTNPAEYPPLEHSSRILARAGWDVLFVGTGSRVGFTLRFARHERIVIRLLPFCPAGWRQKLHYALFAAWVLGWTLRWRPTWVYVSDYLACPIAAMLTLLTGVPVIYHEHDSPSAEASSTSFARFCLAARRWLVRRGGPCILPNAHRAELFARDTGARRNVVCVWNCPGIEEVGPSRVEDTRDGVQVFFHGSIGPDRLPMAVIAAMSLIPQAIRLQVIGYETAGHLGYLAQLREEARRVGVAHRVEFFEPVPTRGDLLKLCRSADVGLALMPRTSPDINLRYMVGASNKPFDYLSQGLAVLVSDLPEWQAAYVHPGYALSCDPDDPSSIAEALRWFLEHPRERRSMAERGRQRIASEWNYETQFAPVYQQLNPSGAT